MKVFSPFHWLFRNRQFIVARAIERFVWDGAKPWVARFFGLRRLKIRALDDWETLGTLLGPPNDFAVCAGFEDRITLQNTSPARAIARMNAHLLDDVALSLNRRGGFAIRGEHMVTRGTWGSSYPKIYFPNSSVGSEVYQADNHVYLAPHRTEITVPEGIYVGSFASHNWFHWIIDTLPVVLALRDLPSEYASYPLLLPSGATAKDSWREALAAVNPGHPVLELPPEVFVRVGRLLMVDGVSNGFPRPLDWPSGVPRIAVRQQAMGDYRNHILGQIAASASSSIATPERIFVARRHQTGRNYNQDQILPIAIQSGFTAVYLEDLSFYDSVRLFSGAKFVVAPHGAGLANALFSNPVTRILFWTWDDSRGDNWYENVFFVAGVQAHRILVVPENRAGGRLDPRGSDYFLEPSEFQVRLGEMLLSGH
jgi:hypothetical protein